MQMRFLRGKGWLGGGESTETVGLEAIPDWEVDERLRRGRRRMKLASCRANGYHDQIYSCGMDFGHKASLPFTFRIDRLQIEVG